MNDILRKIKDELIDSEISGSDLRIALDIIKKYEKSEPEEDGIEAARNKLLKALDEEDIFEYSKVFAGVPSIPNPTNSNCEHCSNNPKNGGSGICHCILGGTPIYSCYELYR